MAGLHWQVAQATSIYNVHVYAPIGGGTTAIGMFTENGSSGFMSDCYFLGGAYGIGECFNPVELIVPGSRLTIATEGGNQQYVSRFPRIYF